MNSRQRRDDGMLPGTNYNHRRRHGAVPREIAEVLVQDIACGRNEHDVTTAEPFRITYVSGRKLDPGTPFCRRCGRVDVLPDKARCPVRMTHGDETVARCVLAKDHHKQGLDHVDEHGHRARIPVHRAS